MGYIISDEDFAALQYIISEGKGYDMEVTATSILSRACKEDEVVGDIKASKFNFGDVVIIDKCDDILYRIFDIQRCETILSTSAGGIYYTYDMTTVDNDTNFDAHTLRLMIPEWHLTLVEVGE